MGGREGAALAHALIIPAAVGTDGDGALHFHPQLLPYKIHRGQDGQEGIPLAATGAAHLTDALQRPGGHLVAQSPGFLGQRGGLGHNGQELARADPRPAGAPKAAGSAGNGLAPAVNLLEGFFQLQRTPGIPVGGKQRRPHHHMVLRTVHMAERQLHHPPHDRHRVGGGFGEAQAKDAVHTLGMAVAADIMSLHTAGLAGFLLMAGGALHHLVLDQIFQGRLANQTFFFVHTHSLQIAASRSSPVPRPSKPTHRLGRVLTA